MTVENWDFTTSYLEYESNIDAYYISKLSMFYFENAKHIYNSNEEVTEFLEK